MIYVLMLMYLLLYCHKKSLNIYLVILGESIWKVTIPMIGKTEKVISSKDNPLGHLHLIEQHLFLILMLFL